MTETKFESEESKTELDSEETETESEESPEQTQTKTETKTNTQTETKTEESPEQTERVGTEEAACSQSPLLNCPKRPFLVATCNNINIAEQPFNFNCRCVALWAKQWK